MLQAIVVLLFAIPIAIFSTENTIPVSITFLNNRIDEVPVYMITLLAFLAGAVLCSIIHLIYKLSASLTIRDQQNEIKLQRRKTAEILKHVHQLEIENAELKSKGDPEKVDEKSL